MMKRIHQNRSSQGLLGGQIETEKSICAVPEYHDIRRRIVSEWLPGSGYQLADTPEISKFHLTYRPHRNERYNEIWIPVKKAD